MADIEILVGAKGGASPSGSSADLIRTQLETALANGVSISVKATQTSLNQLQTDLNNLVANVNVQVAGGGQGPVAPSNGGRNGSNTRDYIALANNELAKFDLRLKGITPEGVAQLDTEIRKVRDELNAAATGGQDAAVHFNNAKNALVEFNTAALNGGFDKSAAALERAKKAAADATKGLANFNAKLQTVKPSALKDFSSEISQIREYYRIASEGGEGAEKALRQAQNASNDLFATFKTLGLEGGNIFTYLEGKIKTFAVYLASSAITMGFVNSVKDAVANVKDLNEEFVNLQIVTGNTDGQTKELLKTYNQLAKEIGSTTKNVASGAQDWLRQGYSAQDTDELLRQSMALSIMGDMPSDESTTALTAAMKGYRLEVEQASDVVDKFFAVDMEAATSSAKLAVALSKTAANAKLARLNLNDVIGQLAVVSETMQEAGESTGTFYNTMLSRMGNLKAGRLSDPETSEDLSDVEATLNGLGIKLRDSNSEFRNFGDVLDEVARKWSSFSSVQQRAVATAFAGTRQQTRFLALMTGWKDAAQYSEAAANSMGVSSQKMQIYEEGIEAKANKMTAAFENLSATLISSDMVGEFYDIGAGALNAVAVFDAWPAKIIAATTALIGLKAVFDSIAPSAFGQSIGRTLKDLGWPEMTGDKYRNIVPSCCKDVA